MTNILNDTKSKMVAAVDHFRKELKALRSGRPNPSLLDSVQVEVYGSEMRLKDLASVSIADSRQLIVTPFDPQTAGPISKGIERANLNLQPILEGSQVRVPIPMLNEEIRRDIIKQAKKKAEDAKVVIREHRRKANEMARKQKADGEIAEDVMKKIEKQIQEVTDSSCKEIDELFVHKEKELLEV